MGGIVVPERIACLSAAQIRAVGTSSAKAGYILDMAKSVLAGDLVLADLADLDDLEVMRTLTSFRGIGNWTAKMYLIFVLNRQDVLPHEDGAFRQAYAWLYNTKDTSPATIVRRCKKWHPYSSIAARMLYQALDLGLTRKKFHLFKWRDDMQKNEEQG